MHWLIKLNLCLMRINFKIPQFFITQKINFIEFRPKFHFHSIQCTFFSTHSRSYHHHHHYYHHIMKLSIAKCAITAILSLFKHYCLHFVRCHVMPRLHWCDHAINFFITLLHDVQLSLGRLFLDYVTVWMM